METPERHRFRRVSDWHKFLPTLEGKDVAKTINGLRSACYRDIETLRGRPLLVYAVQFPPGPLLPGVPHPPSNIDLSDVDGFADLAASVEDHDEVDILIHSPGGSPEATERIVLLLRGVFSRVNFLVPHSAYSAATMLALSGDEIVLHPIACLGPIDPQINGTPSRALRRGFDNAREELKKDGPEALPAYVPLIEKYSLELLEICKDYELLSRELVSEWLTAYMFGGDAAKSEVIAAAVEYFAAYDDHKTHGRSLTFQKVSSLGLNITKAEGELAELLREAHILLSGFFEGTAFFKLFENANGLSWGRQQQLRVAPSDPVGGGNDASHGLRPSEPSGPPGFA